MTGSREQLKSLFFDALDRPSADRAAWLATVSDATLRLELQTLLDAHDSVESVLEKRPVPGLPAGPALASGQRLGPYEILDLVGRGGMGEVYRARDTRLGRLVAVKILPAMFGGNVERQQRFEDEARAASALNHPNVLTIHDIGRLDDGGATFMVMEFLVGETLRARLERAGALSRGQVVDWGLQIARGLTAAHAAGIVHRDIKPENVFVMTDDRVKILDFGIAKLSRSADAVTMVTEPGLIIGTAGYMAPEQVRGKPVDARTDIFAFGTVLFEMAVGRRAFGGHTSIETLSAVLHADPLEDQPPGLAEDPVLLALVRRCMEKVPAERYQSADEIVAALQAVPALSPSAALSPSTAQPHTSSRTPPVRWRMKRSVVAVAAAAAFTVASLAAVLWTWRPATSNASTAAATSYDSVFAVLPFENISADQSQRHLTAGVTEEIVAQLARVASLRLMSRAAVAAYAGAPDAARRLRDDLGVGRLITGSVRLEGDRARISVQLVDTATGQAIWTEQYDARTDDVLKLQNDVAREVSNTLSARLSALERQRLNQPTTANPMAYELYLKARSTRASSQTVAMLQQSVGLDPTFGAAYALLARQQGQLGAFGDARLLDDALESAKKAVAVAPGEARGHHALAVIHLRQGRLADARLAFLRALDLAPNFPDAAWDLSITDASLGRFDESLFWARKGFAMAPNVSTAYYHVAVPLLPLADDGAARRWLLDAEQRFPTAPRIQYMLSELDFLAGNGEASGSRIRRALAAQPDNDELQVVTAELAFLTKASDAASRIEVLFKQSPQARTYLLPESFRSLHAYALWQRGEQAAATALFDAALQSAHTELDQGSELPEVRLEIAAVHALRGNRNEALRWFETAYRAGARLFRELDHDPFFAGVRGDPEFGRIRRQMEQEVIATRKRVDLEANPPLPPMPVRPPGR